MIFEQGTSQSALELLGVGCDYTEGSQLWVSCNADDSPLYLVYNYVPPRFIVCVTSLYQYIDGLPP